MLPEYSIHGLFCIMFLCAQEWLTVGLNIPLLFYNTWRWIYSPKWMCICVYVCAREREKEIECMCVTARNKSVKSRNVQKYSVWLSVFAPIASITNRQRMEKKICFFNIDAKSEPFATTSDSLSYFLMERCVYYRWLLTQQIRDKRRMQYWCFHSGDKKPFLFWNHDIVVLCFGA